MRRRAPTSPPARSCPSAAASRRRGRLTALARSARRRRAQSRFRSASTAPRTPTICRGSTARRTPSSPSMRSSRAIKVGGAGFRQPRPFAAAAARGRTRRSEAVAARPRPFFCSASTLWPRCGSPGRCAPRAAPRRGQPFSPSWRSPPAPPRRGPRREPAAGGSGDFDLAARSEFGADDAPRLCRQRRCQSRRGDPSGPHQPVAGAGAANLARPRRAGRRRSRPRRTELSIRYSIGRSSPTSPQPSQEAVAKISAFMKLGGTVVFDTRDALAASRRAADAGGALAAARCSPASTCRSSRPCRPTTSSQRPSICSMASSAATPTALPGSRRCRRRRPMAARGRRARATASRR